MFLILAGATFLSIVILVNELLSRKKLLKHELPRKIPHVTGSIVAAIWALFLELEVLAVLGLITVVATIFVMKFDLLPYSRKVKRKSWGELLLPLGFAVCAIIANSKWIFIAAVLQVGLADAAAAVVGKIFGKHKFRVTNITKSLEGSLAFLVVSVLIIAWIVLVAPSNLAYAWPVIVWLPIISTYTEAVAPYGLDNLLIPVVTSVALNSLVFIN